MFNYTSILIRLGEKVPKKYYKTIINLEPASFPGEKITLSNLKGALFYNCNQFEKAIEIFRTVEAENIAKYSFDWCHCAEGWKGIFNDDYEARRCLSEAENKADGSYDWCACAETWKKSFNDDYEAKRCLSEAENFRQSLEH